MAYSQAWTGHIGNPSAGTTNTGIDTTSGNTVVVGVMVDSLNTIADGDVTDNKSNTYTRIATIFTDSGRTGAVFYCSNITGGSGHTITVTRGDANYAEVSAVELSSMQTSSFDVSANSGSNPAAADPMDSTAATTTATDTLCGYFIVDGGSVTINAGTGYTARSTPAGGISMLETQDSVASGSRNATASTGASTEYIAFIAAFKEAGGGGGTPFFTRLDAVRL